MSLLASQFAKQVLQLAAFCGTATGTMSSVFSDDAINFSAQATPSAQSSNSIIGVAYGNGIFVIIADNSPGGSAFVSNNGITWGGPFTMPTSGALGWGGVSFANGVFVAWPVASGSPNAVTYSTDGINWTLVSSPFGAAYTRRLGVANSGTFYSCAAGAVNAYQSTNGSSWTATGSNFPGSATADWLTQDANGGLYTMLLPVNASTVTTAYYTASAGSITWTARSLGTAVGFNDTLFAFGNSTYLVAGEDSAFNCQIQTSSVGTGTWTTTSLSGSGRVTGLKFVNGLFVLSTINTSNNQMSVHTSSNGTSWATPFSFTGFNTIPYFSVLNP